MFSFHIRNAFRNTNAKSNINIDFGSEVNAIRDLKIYEKILIQRIINELIIESNVWHRNWGLTLS